MDPNFLHETINLNKTIFNQTIEQPLELDYQLPDYVTGIFKVLQFRAKPHVCSFRSLSEQYIIDGNTLIKLIYIDEEEGNIKSITQNVPFSKTIKLNEPLSNICVFHDIKMNYVNCKIVSSKRIEVKGSISLNLKIYGYFEQQILQNLNEETFKKTSIYLKKQPITITSEQIWNNQQFKISEQFEFENTIQEILDIKIEIVENEHKIISNKIISKATAYLSIIYRTNDKKVPLIQKMNSQINQILEMPNIGENFLCSVNYDVSNFVFQILQDGKIFKLEADGLIYGYACNSKTIEIISDAFSSQFKLEPKTFDLHLFNTLGTFKENLTLTETFNVINFNQIIDVNAQFSNLEYEKISNSLKFSAKLTLNAYGITIDETPEIYEKSIPVAFTIKTFDVQNLNENIISKIKITETDFEIDENKNLNLKINFQINGLISYTRNVAIINNVNVDLKQEKTKSTAAITLYYPQKNDEIWNIAKQFSTSPNEIMQANGLNSEIINDEVMLIIPIV